MTGAPSPDEQIPLFEASLLAEVCAGDEVGRNQLIALFLDQATSAVEQLAAAVAAGDEHEVERLAHRLKGSSAAVGALKLAEGAHRLCEAARADGMKEGAELQAGLERSLESTLSVLTAGGRPGSPGID